MVHLLSEVTCTQVHLHTCPGPRLVSVQVEHKTEKLFTFGTTMDLCASCSFPVNRERVKVQTVGE